MCYIIFILYNYLSIFYTYRIYSSPSVTTSYTAHGGGLLAGLLCGIVFLDTLETTWWSAYVIQPLASIFIFIIPFSMILYYLTENFPPRAIGELFYSNYNLQKPCCWKAMECYDISSTHYSSMYCQLDDDGITQNLFSKLGANNQIETCRQMQAAVDAYF